MVQLFYYNDSSDTKCLIEDDANWLVDTSFIQLDFGSPMATGVNGGTIKHNEQKDDYFTKFYVKHFIPCQL